ncbi:hypothetical protein U0C82_16770 [Fulvimarina sp. 2208YS6-2-32]|uniref:Uncharacterized protein n=1 Tax=Fulvimarina uroteuthidis TaxID=3098149 RepID=A0ABU5I947_9HYPH|nr:hypothetical protein [Fulvimarina sp. 2208YS6-2-32]MDY8110796.1 hypothetical protein [Fulvimarina sp. 2208YS6-2-32]
MDIRSEEIAHFIGLFATAEEEGRARSSFESFREGLGANFSETDLPLFQADVQDSFLLTLYRPNVEYTPPEFFLRSAWTGPGPEAEPPIVPMPDVWQNFGGIVLAADALPFPFYRLTVSGSFKMKYSVEPPADQVAVVILQNASLLDVDIVMFGEGMFSVGEIVVNFEGLERAIAIAETLQPFDMEFDPPQNEAAIAAMIEELTMLVDAIDANGTSSGSSIRGEDASGIFVDGLEVTERPDLAQRLAERDLTEPETIAAEPSTFAKGQSTAGEGVVDVISSFEMESGDNRLTNEVVLYDAMLSGPNMYVGGNYTGVDIIVQTYVLSDRDVVDGVSSMAERIENEAVNVAERLFFSNDPFAGLDMASLALPVNFTLATLEGNFLNLQWIEQTSRLVDDDWIGATRTGAATYLQTGGNGLANSVRLIELGKSFDLIVVLGDVWKANVISQTNILVDEDHVTRFPAQKPEKLALEQGDNLVWNEASIKHFGETTLHQMTGESSALFDALRDGPGAVTLDMLQNSIFAGLGSLDILLIKGDYLELDYIEQTIIASDSDHLRIDENNGPLGENSFETGGNTAINVASILRSGFDQHVEVAGSVYSDALIHQAGFLDDLGSVPTDLALAGDLASEAVLFLADDMLPGQTHDMHTAQTMLPSFQSTDDVLQTMLA